MSNEVKDDQLDSVRVVVRFRPVNSREKAENKDEIVIDIKENTVVQVRDPERRNRAFQFDYVFGMNSAQEAVFEQTGALLVDKVLKGINCTLFAFGQTGSGKTFTMEGVIGNPDNEGLIPRMVRRLFDVILANQKQEPGVQFTLRVSYVEIYNERLRDLLNPENEPVLRGGDNKVDISNAEKRRVNQPSDVFSLLHSGHVNRSVSKTFMNAASSRSHAVFLLYVTREEASGSKKTSKLLMVDLAGSEKIKKTGAADDRLQEAKNINKSLSTLGNVINALTKGHRHIPYRDSILTRLLSDALGGNSKTCLIIACSPAIFNREETVTTLRFGKRAKEIKNSVAVNEELSVKEYKARIAALEAKNCKLSAIISQMIEVAANSSDKSLNLAAIAEQAEAAEAAEADHTAEQKATRGSRAQKVTPNQVRFKKMESHLALEASVVQLERELLDKRRLKDQLAVQRDGHLELRQELEKLRSELQSLHLQKTYFENQCNEHKLLIQSMKLQHKDAEIEFNTKRNLYKNKNRRQADKISKLKAELKETQRFLQMERKLRCRTEDDERKPSTPKKLQKMKYSNLDYSDPNKRDNKNHIDELEIAFTVTDDQPQKEQIKQVFASAREINEDCRLLKRHTKKLYAHLDLYKQRDVTNNLLRQIWLKNLKQLEQSLCEQFAVNERLQLNWRYKQIQFEDELNRLRQIIQSFREYESNQQQQQFKSVIAPSRTLGRAFNYPRAMSVPPSSNSTSASTKRRGAHAASRSRDFSIGNPEYKLYEASQMYMKNPSPYMDEMKNVNGNVNVNVNVDRGISGNSYNYGNHRVRGWRDTECSLLAQRI